MTRPGVTYFDVANIAQQLIASGYEPTIERIRSQLKTGSNTETIYEQNKVLAHDKWMLGQEKAQLFGQLKQWESMVKTG
jgi:Plasmid replication region DNA-binding N-term